MDIENLENLTIDVSKSAWIYLGATLAVTAAGHAVGYYVHLKKLKKTREFVENVSDESKVEIHV